MVKYHRGKDSKIVDYEHTSNRRPRLYTVLVSPENYKVLRIMKEDLQDQGKKWASFDDAITVLIERVKIDSRIIEIK